VRAERLDQTATVLAVLYPSLHEALPPMIAEKLERLERAERRSRQLTDS
jgi:hypothetical protein